MAVIDYIDGPNRDIYLSAETVSADLEPMDVYKEMRALRRIDEELRKYDVFLEAKGYEPTGGGKFTARYVVELDGTRLIPYDTSHELTVIGTIITDDGQSGINCFDRSPLSPSTVVDINYIPPQVEIIEVGTSGLTDAESEAILQNTADLSAIAGDFETTDDSIAIIQTDIGQIKLDIAGIEEDTAFMVAIESGEWHIVANQMIFYDTGGTEIVRFDLQGQTGDPAMVDVFRRVPV